MLYVHVVSICVACGNVLCIMHGEYGMGICVLCLCVCVVSIVWHVSE